MEIYINNKIINSNIEERIESEKWKVAFFVELGFIYALTALFYKVVNMVEGFSQLEVELSPLSVLLFFAIEIWSILVCKFIIESILKNRVAFGKEFWISLIFGVNTFGVGVLLFNTPFSIDFATVSGIFLGYPIFVGSVGYFISSEIYKRTKEKEKLEKLKKGKFTRKLFATSALVIFSFLLPFLNGLIYSIVEMILGMIIFFLPAYDEAIDACARVIGGGDE